MGPLLIRFEAWALPISGATPCLTTEWYPLFKSLLLMPSLSWCAPLLRTRDWAPASLSSKDTSSYDKEILTVRRLVVEVFIPLIFGATDSLHVVCSLFSCWKCWVHWVVGNSLQIAGQIFTGARDSTPLVGKRRRDEIVRVTCCASRVVIVVICSQIWSAFARRGRQIWMLVVFHDFLPGANSALLELLLGWLIWPDITRLVLFDWAHNAA